MDGFQQKNSYQKMKNIQTVKKSFRDFQLKWKNFNCKDCFKVDFKVFIKIFGIILFSLLTFGILIYNLQIEKKQDQTMEYFINSQQAFSYNNNVGAQPKFENQEENQVPTKQLKKWQLQKILWVYKSQKSQEALNNKLFNSLNYLNTKYFAQKGNYKLNEINDVNYPSYLSLSASQKISSVIETIQKRLNDQDYQSLHQEMRDNKEKIIKRLIIYFALLEKGGVFIDDSVTVLESFHTWLKDILNVPYINVGDKINSKIQPKCFGFYHKKFSSLRTKMNVKREFEFEKYIVAFPSLQDQFLACNQGNEFLQRVIEAYLLILQSELKIMKLQKFNKDQKLIGKTNPLQIYNHGHLLAIHSVLQQHQYYLNLNSKTPFNKLAIDDFGLVTINAYLGPRKIMHSFWQTTIQYSFLSKLPIKELEDITGPLKFITIIDNHIKKQFLDQVVAPQTQTKFFMQNSFIGTYLLRFWPQYQKDSKALSLNSQSQKTQNAVATIPMPQIEKDFSVSTQHINNPQWSSLDKHVWVIWDKGIKGKSSLVIELCFQNLKRSAKNSGFQFHLVTDSNIKYYIGDQMLQKIKYALSHAAYYVTKQAETDFWRLALLYKYGGIYLDASTFTIDRNFEWLKNITRIPQNLIWNRYGKQPQTLMFYNAYYAHPADWYFDRKYKTKSQWQLSYENNFIATVKNSELIKQWIEVFMQWMMSPYERIQFQMKEVGMLGYQWTSRQSRYLMSMDAIKYVIGRRQKFLTDTKNTQYETASDYYKIWSMGGNMNGQQKLRGETNYQNDDYRLHWIEFNYNNVFRHQYPTQLTESIIGPVTYQSKFFGFDLRRANIFLERFYKERKRNFNFETLHQVIHPNSILATKVLNTNPENTVNLIKFYGNLNLQRVKLRSLNKLGI